MSSGSVVGEFLCFMHSGTISCACAYFNGTVFGAIHSASFALQRFFPTCVGSKDN